jgi:site-specific recombinase XerD
MSVFFHTLYHTGLRVAELHEFHRWQLFSPSQAIVRLSKGETARIIDLSLLPVEVKDYLECGDTLPWNYSIRQYRVAMQRCLPFSYYISGDKVLQFHLFRHNYVRKLISNGMSELEVVQHIGWLSIDSYVHYRDRVIYCR